MVRILIVDDHPIVREGLARLIAQKSKDDFEIVAATGDPDEALSLVQTLEPDMLIVDIFLEGMDGINLIKCVRTLRDQVRILALSMYDESLYAERALEAGADGYIMKQEEPSTIFKAIATVAQGEVYFSRPIVTKLLRGPARKTAPSPGTSTDVLTDRELETFRLLGLGWTTRRIARELHISIKTVETHHGRIKMKLGLSNYNELIQRAVQWVQSGAGEPPRRP